MRPFVKYEIVVLVQFYLCQMDIFYYYRYAQMRSRSTFVDPNGRRQLKVCFVEQNQIRCVFGSRELDWDQFDLCQMAFRALDLLLSEAIVESGRR